MPSCMFHARIFGCADGEVYAGMWVGLRFLNELLMRSYVNALYART